MERPEPQASAGLQRNVHARLVHWDCPAQPPERRRSQAKGSAPSADTDLQSVSSLSSILLDLFVCLVTSRLIYLGPNFFKQRNPTHTVIPGYNCGRMSRIWRSDYAERAERSCTLCCIFRAKMKHVVQEGGTSKQTNKSSFSCNILHFEISSNPSWSIEFHNLEGVQL